MSEVSMAFQLVNSLWRRWWRKIALLAILVVALSLRAAATNFGLPHTYHPDEGALVMPALRILQTGDFNPHRFDYGSAYIYTLSGVYVLYFLVGARAGVFHSIQDIPVIEDYVSIVRYPFPTVFLTARLLNAVIGTLTVLAVYLLVRRLLSRKHALIAALLLAVAPLHVILSHFGTADVPMVLAATVSLLAMLQARDSCARIDRLVAAFLCGLTMSIKYPAAPIIAPLVILFLQTTAGKDRIWLEAALGCLALAAGFLFGTPYSLLDLPTFLNWLAYDLRLYGPAESARVVTSLGWYLDFLFSEYSNVWLTVSALLGIPFLQKKISTSTLWLVFTFPALFAVQVSLASVHFSRTILPLWPFLVLLASVAVVDGSGWAAQRLRFDPVWPATILLIVLALVMGFTCVRYDHMLAQDDVRTHALYWIEANLPHGSRLVVDRFPPSLSPEEWKVTQVLHVADYSLDWYREQRVQYLVVSQAMRNNDNRTEVQEHRYQMIESEFRLLATIEGPFIGNAGFHMWIYQVPLAPKEKGGGI